jgi:putative endopeptidase
MLSILGGTASKSIMPPAARRLRERISGSYFLLLAALVFLLPFATRAQSLNPSRMAPTLVSPDAAAGGSGCAAAESDGGTGEAGPAAKADESADHGFDLTNLDRSVSPCDNFYEFAVGGWLKSNPIPSDRPEWGTFNKLQDHNQDVLHQILEEAAKDTKAEPGSNWQKIGDYYASCMNESQIASAGLKPLDPELQRIAAIKDTEGLQSEIARLQKMGVNAGFYFSSEQDLKDSSKEIAGAGQGGLGLPDRQYYVDDDARSKQLRSEYVQHVTNMFKLVGDSPAEAAKEANVVIDIETALAKVSTKREDLRDPDRNYHPMSVAELDQVTPHFSWSRYFREAGAPASVSMADMGQPEFFKGLDAEIASVPIDNWKIYLRWHLIHAAAPALTEPVIEENFNFYGRTLTGAPQNLPRWRRCVESTDRELGEALGQYYVKRAFPPEAKARALAMVHNLIAALRDDLETLPWMSPTTRQKAIEKLGMIQLKIGYPDKWRDYSAYKVVRGAYVENIFAGDRFEFARELNKIGKPVDRTEWEMTPPTVNAYYEPYMNEIVFPAGILQPPFFDFHADDAINYGGIGAVIGHEITHGFDDQGSKFDGHGNRVNWWTPDDLKNFEARGECIVKQFDAEEVEPGLHENGKLVEGESIADLGGMTIAYAALQNTLKGKPAPPKIDGFTADQRFFLGWAQVWATNYRPEYARLIAKTNEHPLDKFRANAPLSNTPAFAHAFSCSEKSQMVRPEGARCRIW